MGVAAEACLASRAVVIVAEQIASRDTITSDPNRVLAPAFKVDAVVHEPFACHPSPMQGFYDRDHAFYHEYHEATRTADGFARWEAEWVRGVSDRTAYMRKLGRERMERLFIRRRRLAAEVDYGL
jgi:glutaconate CoA-transferase subunit A